MSNFFYIYMSYFKTITYDTKNKNKYTVLI